MKRKNILLYLLLLLPALLMQSCLKDQEDTFDQASSNRLQQYLTDTQKTLMGSEYGWVFEVFPEPNQLYGGYVFTCEFDSLQVRVGSELGPGEFYTSYYKMTNEVGPAITFDTYNPLMHFFSDPSSAQYQAYQGDFEFVVDSIGTDVVKVHGYRTGNTLYMYRLTKPADEYLADVAAFKKQYSDDTYTLFAGSINGVDVSGEIDASNLYADMTTGDISSEPSFVYTSTGLRFYEPIQVGDATFRELTYDSEKKVYTGTDSKGQAFTLQASYPEWVAKYFDWVGDYTFTFREGEEPNSALVNKDVKLVPLADKSGFEMQGLNPNYSILLRYVKATNSLELYTQVVGDPLPTGNVVRMVSWDVNAGYIIYDESPATTTRYNAATDSYDWVDNGVWGTYKVTGFILYEFTPDLGTRVGWLSSTYSSYYINGNNFFCWPTSLKKK